MIWKIKQNTTTFLQKPDHLYGVVLTDLTITAKGKSMNKLEQFQRKKGMRADAIERQLRNTGFYNKKIFNKKLIKRKESEKS